jgi:hypothetical protein
MRIGATLAMIGWCLVGVAQAGAAPGPVHANVRAPDPEATSADGQPSPQQPLTNVIANIQHNWIPNCSNPQQVTVTFQILANGYLDGEPEVSGSADNSVVESALAAVHKAEPLRLPAELVGRKIRVHFNAAEPCR